jgi:hypothetical protein
VEMFMESREDDVENRRFPLAFISFLHIILAVPTSRVYCNYPGMDERTTRASIFVRTRIVLSRSIA